MTVRPVPRRLLGSPAAALRQTCRIKQHFFCKSPFSEVGHLASMFREARSVSQSSLISEKTAEASRKREASGEECCDAGASVDFPVELLETVGGAKPPPVSGRDREHAWRLATACSSEAASSRSRLLVAGDDFLQSPLGLGRLVGVEDATEVAGHFRADGDLGHVRHGVIDRMEIGTAATAPRLESPAAQL